MQAEQSAEGDSGEKPIGLPDSLRRERGEEAASRPVARPSAMIGAVPAPPKRADGLPLWAVIVFAATALLAASWLAVMASLTLRALGWH